MSKKQHWLDRLSGYVRNRVLEWGKEQTPPLNKKALTKRLVKRAAQNGAFSNRAMVGKRTLLALSKALNAILPGKSRRARLMPMLYNRYILTADVPNANKRVYPLKEVEQLIVTSRRQHRQIYGTIGMPEKIVMNEQLANVPHSKRSHEVVSMFLDDKNRFLCDIRVLDTEAGACLKKMIDNGISVDFRLAGLAEIDQQKASDITIIRNYQLHSINAVQDGA